MSGYLIPNKTTLKGIIAIERQDGLAYLVKVSTNNNPEWFMFVADSTVVADDNTVLIPDDNPAQGRWHLTNQSLQSSSGLASALRLQLVSTPPITGDNEIALFGDATDNKIKVRQPNNGDIYVLGEISSVPPSSSDFGNDSDVSNDSEVGN